MEKPSRPSLDPGCHAISNFVSHLVQLPINCLLRTKLIFREFQISTACSQPLNMIPSCATCCSRGKAQCKPEEGRGGLCHPCCLDRDRDSSEAISWRPKGVFAAGQRLEKISGFAQARYQFDKIYIHIYVYKCIHTQNKYIYNI